jgi:hypothetical protein
LTSCGIPRKDHGEGYRDGEESTEDTSPVSRPYCVEPIQPTACRLAAAPCSFRKAAQEKAGAVPFSTKDLQ